MAGKTYTSKTPKGAARNPTAGTEDVTVFHKHLSFLDKRLAPKDKSLERAAKQSRYDEPLPTREADKARTQARAGERAEKSALRLMFLGSPDDDEADS